MKSMKENIQQAINENCEDVIMELLKERVKKVRQKLKTHEKFMKEIKKKREFADKIVHLITEEIKLQKEIEEYEDRIKESIKLMKCKYLRPPLCRWDHSIESFPEVQSRDPSQINNHVFLGNSCLTAMDYFRHHCHRIFD